MDPEKRETALAVRGQGTELAQPLPIESVLARHRAIGSIMHDVMRRGTDYDVIPGTGSKPTLLKAGAETLATCFNLHPEISSTVVADDPAAELRMKVKKSREKGGGVEEVTCRGWFEVRATCAVVAADGSVLARASGSCSNREAKYARQAVWDVRNTVLKMAEKRALVAAMLLATGASRMFTQDVEDMPRDEAPRPAAAPARPGARPQRQPQRPAAAPGPFERALEKIRAAQTPDEVDAIEAACVGAKRIEEIRAACDVRRQELDPEAEPDEEREAIKSEGRTIRDTHPHYDHD